MVQVKHVMTRKIVKVQKGTTLKKAAEIMQRKKLGSVVVADGRKILGILTEGDIVRRVVAVGADPRTTTVVDAMSAPFLVIEATHSVMDANDIMDQEHVRHLGVIDHQKVIGIVSVRDLLRHVYGSSRGHGGL